MLQAQVEKLQKDFDQASQPAVTEKPAKSQVSPEEKKLKIESAMANAAVKKAQRALDNADGDTAALETALVAARAKAAEASKALEEAS